MKPLSTARHKKAIQPSPLWGEGLDEGNIKPEIVDFRHICPPHPTLSPRGEGLLWNGGF